MSLRNKIVLGVSVVLIAAGGALFYLNGSDDYDPTQYEATVTRSEQPSSLGQNEPNNSGLTKGARVELTLPDQFGVSHTVGPEVKTLVLAFSKTTGGTVRGYLDQQDANYLSTHNAAFIADISPFPVVMRNTFALPLLRKSAYPVLLLYDPKLADALKNREHADKITVATLVGGVVQELKYVTTETELATGFR